jgi:hypothetical protein
LQGLGFREVLKYSISFKGRREKSFSCEKIPNFIFGGSREREFSSEITNFSFGQGRKNLTSEKKYPISVLGRGEKFYFWNTQLQFWAGEKKLTSEKNTQFQFWAGEKKFTSKSTKFTSKSTFMRHGLHARELRMFWNETNTSMVCI